MKQIMDIELELDTLIYIFTVGIAWLLMAFIGRGIFINLYNPIPDVIQTFITISFWIAGGGLLVAVGLSVWTILE